MEIEYQLSKKDYTEFNKLYCKNELQKRILVVIALIFISAFAFGGSPFNWKKLVIGTSVSAVVIFGIYYFIPVLRAAVSLNKALGKEKTALEKKKLTITNEGLLIESESNVTTWKWPSITSIHSNTYFIYIFLVDKRYLLLPKRCLSAESECTNFMGMIQNKIVQVGMPSNTTFNRIIKKPGYSIGLICLIPLIGAIAGIIFIANGISNYKDKWFILMGIGGVVFNACLFFLLFYHFNLGKEWNKQFVWNSQMQLNTLMKDIEFYKIKNGAYPDSLEQITKGDPMADIFDPIQSEKNAVFNYQKVGNHYYLFSSGIDGVPNTGDDIYPQVANPTVPNLD